MRKIFINYRRAEAEYAAGARGRELRRHFGDDRIFRDKEDIGGGASWKRRVLDEINGESALLILIGRDWATVTDAQGRRRLDNPDDPLRMEIADGLKDGAAILPILLENAEMPADTELPDDLRSITEHNALRLPTDEGCALRAEGGQRLQGGPGSRDHRARFCARRVRCSLWDRQPWFNARHFDRRPACRDSTQRCSGECRTGGRVARCPRTPTGAPPAREPDTSSGRPSDCRSTDEPA